MSPLIVSPICQDEGYEEGDECPECGAGTLEFDDGMFGLDCSNAECGFARDWNPDEDDDEEF